MLGIKNFDYRQHRRALENFFQLAECGKILRGDSRGHCDGWGIGYYQNGRAFLHKSGRSIIADKEDYFRRLEKIDRSPVLIVHLRKSAWKNTSTAEHSHPFLYKNFLFAQNGTIYDYKKLLPEITETKLPSSEALDTEVYFHYSLNSAALGLENAFRKSIQKIEQQNKYSALNCLFSDGKKLYAYRDYCRSPGYYTLYQAKFGKSKLISSEPVSPQLKWRMLKKRELLVVK
ncbi:MAG: class II glutamine amidotransferase [Elusimicrobiota bacterium]